MTFQLEVLENKRTIIIEDRKSGKVVAKHQGPVYFRKSSEYLYVHSDNQSVKYSKKHYKVKGWF